MLLPCALLIEAVLVLIHAARSPAEQVGLVLLAYGVGGAAYVRVLWCLRSAGRERASRGATITVLAAAVVFRMTLLPLQPATSPDVHRYMWEGVVQLRGLSPYALAPAAPELDGVAAEFPALAWAVRRPEVHQQLPSIYPPVGQMLFVLNAALFGGALLGWKVLLLCFDGLLAAGAWLVLRRRGLGAVHLAGVLWCPLLLIECYEGGHLDLVGAALVLVALAAFERGRPHVAGGALGLAFNVKYLWPGALILLLAGVAWRRRCAGAFLGTAALVVLAGWIPYRSELPAALATARVFAESWTFNDVVFELLRMCFPGWRLVPTLIVIGVLAGLGVGLVWRRGEEVWSDAWLLAGAGVLLSPVAYPWYFVWVVPGLAYRPPGWLVVWVLSVPALHVVDWRYVATGEWDPLPWLWVVVGSLPAILLVRAWWRRLIRGAV